jgi:serine-type D-Ala-D-Ala carboxypeptidase/endopeptidase (penicillin-binding protein 4)
MQFTPVSQQSRGRSRDTRRSSDPVRFVLIAGLVGAVLLTGAYFYIDALAQRSVAKSTQADVATARYPVLSARRTPTILSTTSRVGSVRRALANVATRLPSGACLRVDWLGATLLSVRSDVVLIPASASKLTTAAVALEVLGPDHTFETQIFADPISSSGSTQNLYVVGGGDPVLVTSNYTALERYPTLNGTSLETLVTTVAASGIRQITGSIVIVDNRYDQERFVDQWPSSFYGVEAGPLGALMFNDGVVTSEALRPDDPGLAAGTELSALLSQQGIGISSSIQRGTAVPNTATQLASITSAPLTAIVQELLVNSDNNTAELLVKEMGYVKKGVGSTQAGLEVMNETIKTWGTSLPAVVDGSGLSSSNSATCDFFVDLLNRNKDSFPSLLAVAGQSGTLKNTFIDSPVEDRLAGKTGTLTGVKALVGYLPLESEEDVQFSLLMNASGIDNQSSYRPIWNALGDALNRARAVPRPEQLTP